MIDEQRDTSVLAAQLYEILLGSLQMLDRRDAVAPTISPDGPLQFIPFQALKRTPDGPYLID